MVGQRQGALEEGLHGGPPGPGQIGVIANGRESRTNRRVEIARESWDKAEPARQPPGL